MNKLLRIGVPVLAVLLLAISVFGAAGVVSADNRSPQTTGVCSYYDNDGDQGNALYPGNYTTGSGYSGYRGRGMMGGGYGSYQGRNMMGW